MPRRPRIHKRVILPDPVYTHEGVAKFVNVVMQRGKRSTAERVVYGSLDRIKKVAKKDPIEVFDAALKNATPVLEVKPRRRADGRRQWGRRHHQAPRRDAQDG